jgi:polyhydroxyalkanoate synthesis regulator phasin
MTPLLEEMETLIDELVENGSMSKLEGMCLTTLGILVHELGRIADAAEIIGAKREAE